MISSIDDAIKEREENKKLALHPEHEEYLKHAVLIEEKCSGVKGRDEIVQVGRLLKNKLILQACQKSR